MKRMKYFLMGTALLTIGAMANQALAQTCAVGTQQVPLKGKIFNNLTATGRTLGVVSLVLGDEKRNAVKAKCGIIGDPLPADPSFALKFTHTIVCEEHSQLSFATQGNITNAFPTGMISFEEFSTPILTLPKTGLFANITTGSAITIVGTLNSLGEIDMTFEGNVCFLP
jgi:hypothetical protein